MHVSWHLTRLFASRRAAERLAAKIPVSVNGNPRNGKPAQRETADAGRRRGRRRTARGCRRRGPGRGRRRHVAVAVGVTARIGTSVPAGPAAR